jgi:2-polyprenyl-3-methyl-5-hydroxy-6-metoxy-1,4-benzoquinol methylase
MPTISENLHTWNTLYDWSGEGAEWSREFGGTEALWWFVIYPRIHRFLPASTILEIAPGYGRWTQFLGAQCQSMIAVDLSEKCIAQCKKRYASSNHIKFIVNDGESLAAIPDQSVDFVFSFDSLVHAEKDVLEAYVTQLAEKLRPDGVGFIHHSNLGSYEKRILLRSRYLRLHPLFRRYVLTENLASALLSINLEGWRATSMTAELFRTYCAQAGLKCVSQELISWGKGGCLIDGLSVFAKPNSRWDERDKCLRNEKFVEYTHLTSRLAGLYCDYRLKT